MNFQARVQNWVLATFGEETANDKKERANRFLEEALELYQSCDMDYQDVNKLANYVFSRPKGLISQEVGGVLVTLASLCSTHRITMKTCGSKEIERCETNFLKIREKHRNKPRNSPLPGDYPA